MNEGILLASDIDFMIHGIFKVKVFGQEVWITDSHACILIVMAVMVIFAVIANRKLKHATEKPDAFQNIIELIVEKLDGMVDSTMGKWAPRFVNYISTIFIFILMSNISAPADGRLRNHACTCTDHIFHDPFQQGKTPESERNMDRYVFTASAMASTLGADQHYQ